jgi:hypothetical protein
MILVKLKHTLIHDGMDNVRATWNFAESILQ